jgi:hypothetical protein
MNQLATNAERDQRAKAFRNRPQATTNASVHWDQTCRRETQNTRPDQFNLGQRCLRLSTPTC